MHIITTFSLCEIAYRIERVECCVFRNVRYVNYNVKFRLVPNTKVRNSDINIIQPLRKLKENYSSFVDCYRHKILMINSTSSVLSTLYYQYQGNNSSIFSSNSEAKATRKSCRNKCS